MLTSTGSLIFAGIDIFALEKNGSHGGALGLDLSSAYALDNFNTTSACVRGCSYLFLNFSLEKHWKGLSFGFSFQYLPFLLDSFL